MKYPKGKTPAQLTANVHQSELNEFDTGYIDGYLRGNDDRPYVVFVRETDGHIDMVPFCKVRALFDT